MADSYKITLGNHRNLKVIFIHFPYTAQAVKNVKNIGAKFSNTCKAWYLNDTAQNRKNIHTLLNHAEESLSRLNISTENKKALDKYIQMLELKAYSTSTIKTYKNEFVHFLILLKQTDASTCSAEIIKRYLHYCINTLELKEATLHSKMNALKFYYEKV